VYALFMMEVALGVPFGFKPSEELKRLLEGFGTWWTSA